MSWIDDLANSIVNALVEGTGAIFNVVSRLTIQRADQNQHDLVQEKSGKGYWIPTPQEFSALTTGRQDEVDMLDWLSQQNGEPRFALYARQAQERARLDPDRVRQLYLRGMIDEEERDELLDQIGLWNDAPHFTGPDGLTEYGAEFTETGDRERWTALWQRLPGLGDLITMETRDVFPLDPEREADWIKETEEYGQWLRDVYTPDRIKEWLEDPTEDITDAAAADTKFGPQSFASWFLGARKRYTDAYEAVARSEGVESFWAMKYWESHWQLPSWRMARWLLWRSPKVTPEMFKTILAWQDYPPALLDAITDASYQPLTRVDVRRMYADGVLTLDEVFRAYLDEGYSPTNAMRMTAWTHTYEQQRLWSGPISEVLEAYISGSMSGPEAKGNLIGMLGLPDSASPTDWAQDNLSDAELDALRDAYDHVRKRVDAYVSKQLAMAQIEANLSLTSAHVDTAEDAYTDWRWTREETLEYLTDAGIGSDRAEYLVKKWEPVRRLNERLPTRAMLRDWLVEQDMPVNTWEEYMRRLGYSDTTIQQILMSTEKLPSRSMLRRWLQRNRIPVEAWREYMQRLGYSDEVIAAELATANKLPSVGMVRTWLRREIITEERGREYLLAHGYSEEAVNAIIGSLYQPPERADIRTWYQSGLIDADTAAQWLRDGGYNPTTAQQLVDQWT